MQEQVRSWLVAIFSRADPLKLMEVDLAMQIGKVRNSFVHEVRLALPHPVVVTGARMMRVDVVSTELTFCLMCSRNMAQGRNE